MSTPAKLIGLQLWIDHDALARFIELELEDDGTRARWEFDGTECHATETPPG
jgi:hypothetical protein